MTASHPLDRFATWRELQSQPEIWAAWGRSFDSAGLRQWIAAQDVSEVWFCGAGSSAYIGDIIVAGLEGKTGCRFRAVPTTDLVGRPQDYLGKGRPLVVSFGRSGNSAESIGVLDALDALAPDAPRLNITCNADSVLARRPSAAPQRVVILPAATHDAGFAMTSSFSTMLLTALELFDPAPDFSARMGTLSAALKTALPAFLAMSEPLLPPDRVVFVGTGPLAFAAREAALKVMELSAGRIAALWDSTLGFRHGPKSFVQPGTTIFVFTAPEPTAARYDADLVAELRSQFPQSNVVSIGPGGDIALQAGLGAAWGAVLPVAFAQVLAVVWSDRMGLPVDDPFAGLGTLSRVVSGVRLYPVQAA